MTSPLPAHVDFEAVVLALVADPETAPAVRAVIAEQDRVRLEEDLALVAAFEAEDAERSRRRASFRVV